MSLVLRENAKAVYFSEMLAKEGYFAPAIKTPSVPQNKALLRFSLTANLEFKSLENLVKILQKIAYAAL